MVKHPAELSEADVVWLFYQKSSESWVFLEDETQISFQCSSGASLLDKPL